MFDPRAFLDGPVIVQRGTGRVGRAHILRMRAAGTRIGAVVSPSGRVQEQDGIPVFTTMALAVAAVGASTSVCFVGAANLLKAMTEALAAGIRKLVTPTEGMPVHDALAAYERVTAVGGHWIGASTPGMAIPGRGKLGFLPDASLAPGTIGIMSKSGTLSYEAGYRLARLGLGQSVWVGVGGDPVKGTRFAELLPFYAADKQTNVLLLIGEIGGTEEEEAAVKLHELKFAKPVFALIAGATAPEGTVMGHAGAMVDGAAGSFESKRAALESAGVRVLRSLPELEAAFAGRSAPGSTA